VANLQIKALPDEVHEELRRRARFEGISVRDYVLRMIRDDLETPSKAEWAARMRSRSPLPIGNDAADQVRADRAERADRVGGAGRDRSRPAAGD